MNSIGWILVAVGLAGVIASAIGIVVIFVQQPTQPPPESFARLYLHDTYYAFSRPTYTIWPLILCIALSLAICVTGYMHTKHFVRHVIPAGTILLDADLDDQDA